MISRGWDQSRGTLRFVKTVCSKEEQAELLAHLLDDAVRLPGTSLRFGLDPIVGLVPVIGDALVTACGATILLIARQLRVPFGVLCQMAYNQLVNGLVGAFPFVGDAYSFWFKSHAKNTALMVRAVKGGEAGTCPLVVPSLGLLDVGLVLILTAPTVVVVGYVSLWLLERGFSILSILMFL